MERFAGTGQKTPQTESRMKRNGLLSPLEHKKQSFLKNYSMQPRNDLNRFIFLIRAAHLPRTSTGYPVLSKCPACTAAMVNPTSTFHATDIIKASYREGIDTLEEYRENKRILQQERETLEMSLQDLKHDSDTANENLFFSMLVCFVKDTLMLYFPYRR